MATAACAWTQAQHPSCAGVSWAVGRTDLAERSRRNRTCRAHVVGLEVPLCVHAPLLQRPRSRAYAMRHSPAQQGSAAYDKERAERTWAAAVRVAGAFAARFA